MNKRRALVPQVRKSGRLRIADACWASPTSTGGSSRPDTIGARLPTGRGLRNESQAARNRIAVVALCIVSLLLCCARLADGDDRFWNSPTGGAFGNSALWNPMQTPGVNDVAIFDLPNVYTVTFGLNPTNQRLLARNGFVTLDLGGHTYNLTQTGASSPSIVIGQDNGSVADLRIVNGTLSGQVAMIGQFSGSQGTARVTGSNAAWNNASTLFVGASGQGLLVVTSGGTVTSSGGFVGNGSGSTGTATIGGVGSSWTGMNQLVVGNNGSGTLNIQSGGGVSNTVGYIGRFSNSTGAATVTGANSVWNNNGSLYVGGSDTNAGGTGGLSVLNNGRVNVGGTLRVWGGTGTLTVDGGLVEATNITIDPGAALNWDNQGTLRINGGTITGLVDANNTLLVGSGGGQNLEILAGATLNSDFAHIGSELEKVGSVKIHGGNSHWINASSLQIGNQGQGVLSIGEGGQVNSDHSMIGLGSMSSGVVSVDGAGSQWINAWSLDIGVSGQGTLQVTNGGIASNQHLAKVGGNESSIGRVVVSGTGSVWNSSSMTIGLQGQGEVTIAAGGLVSSGNGYIGEGSSGSGHVSVTGHGSQWLVANEIGIGFSGQGSLTIESGGIVNTQAGFASIGGMGDSVGTAAVTGNDSQWIIASDLFIGDRGQGVLDIDLGGAVSASDVFIGWQPGSQGALNAMGAGSSLTSQQLHVGAGGQGSLTISDGAKVSSVQGSLGLQTGSLGNALVTGPGARWMTSGLFVGDAGSGELNIVNGGFVSSTDGVVGRLSDGVVNVSGNGSSWHVGNQLELGGSGGVSGGPATLTIGPGGTVDVGSQLRLYDDATLNLFGGTLRLNETIQRATGSAINYLSGTVQLVGDRTIGTDAAANAFFGAAPNIGTGKHLHVTGTATLFAPTTLSGGTLTVADLVNASLLNFNSGTFNLTNKSLTIGSGGMFGDSLSLGSGQAMNVSIMATVAGGGVLTVDNGGRFYAETLYNYGDVFLGGNNARIGTSDVTTMYNHGLVAGGGRIDGSFVNESGGIVELETGKRLTFSDPFYNLAGGRILGRGSLVAPTLDNHGQMLFSGGFTDIHAPITSYDGSQIIITGGGTTTIFGDVEIQGGAELRLSDLSNGVFFDHVQLRNGALLTGGGNAFFEGSLGIGDSPSRQEFNFNVTLGPTSNLIVEIAGTDPHLPEFDQYVFLKNLTLQGGALTVDLIGLAPEDDAFQPKLGDSFTVLEVYGDWIGQFGRYDLPALTGRLEWNLSALYSEGTIFVSQAIPEPSWGLLISAVLFAWCATRRRSRVPRPTSSISCRAETAVV